MSGESGARIAAEHFHLFVGRGICEDHAMPDHDDGGAAMAARLAAECAPYDRWLARAAPALDALFAELIAAGELPIVAASAPAEQIDGAIIDDTSGRPDDRARHFATYHRGGPLAVHVAGPGRLPDGQSLHLALVVADRVHRSALDRLLGRVTAVLLAHRDDPPPPAPPPPPPPPPESPPGWFTRLRRHLDRQTP